MQTTNFQASLDGLRTLGFKGDINDLVQVDNFLFDEAHKRAKSIGLITWLGILDIYPPLDTMPHSEAYRAIADISKQFLLADYMHATRIKDWG